MAITIRLGDGKARKVTPSQGAASAQRKARVQKILKEHSEKGEDSVSKTLSNRFERTRLLKQLREVGMREWVRNGSKAQFDQLVKQAASTPFDGYLTDYGQWEKKYGNTSKQAGDEVKSSLVAEAGTEQDGLDDPLIVNPEILRVGAYLAERARKLNEWGPVFTIRSNVPKKERGNYIPYRGVAERRGNQEFVIVVHAKNSEAEKSKGEDGTSLTYIDNAGGLSC
ncbi:hypothetical protein D3C81_55180 [compost metagenome]